MVDQLRERSRLKKALGLAMEVQQNLLPGSDPEAAGLDIAAKSIYCDETGGDYYDFLDIGGTGSESIGIAVGDVSEHGIPSALLMASARAFLRQRAALSDDLGAIVTDVNRQLARDVEGSGRFMTLLLLVVDSSRQNLQWVRAGHDPAILYDPVNDRFEELRGGGLALGVDEAFVYRPNTRDGLEAGQIIVLGSDGVWEAQNPGGDFFGKQPLYDILRHHQTDSAKNLLQRILSELRRFQENRPPQDDVTLVIVKIGEAAPPKGH